MQLPRFPPNAKNAEKAYAAEMQLPTECIMQRNAITRKMQKMQMQPNANTRKMQKMQMQPNANTRKMQKMQMQS